MERLENTEAHKGFSLDSLRCHGNVPRQLSDQGFVAWAEGILPKFDKFSWEMKKIKGLLQQGSRAYTSSARGRAQTSTRPSLPRRFSAGHSESLTKGSELYWSQQPALPPEPRTRGAAPFRTGDRQWPGRRRSAIVPGQPVGGRTSQSSTAPGSDDHCLLPDASGSASAGRAGSEAVPREGAGTGRG